MILAENATNTLLLLIFSYCGSTFEPTVLTERNYLGLVFTSGPDVVQTGFKATASLLTGLYKKLVTELLDYILHVHVYT